MVYNEWKNSLIRGFTSNDLYVCPKGSVFYLGLVGGKIEPLFVSRTLGGEMFNAWFTQYMGLLSKAPVDVVPRYERFYAVSPVDEKNWSADEFYMEKIAGKDYIRPVLGARSYAGFSLPSLELVIELCRKAQKS
jgi:hypothetical protein